MSVYRGGEGQSIIGAADRLNELLQELQDAIDAANDAMIAAQTAASNAETAYNNLNNLYLGEFTSDPTLDNDGSTLDGGELYYNSVSNKLLVYDSGDTAWKPSYGDIRSDGTVPMAADFDMAGHSLLDYTESTSSPSSVSGSITFDLDVGNIFTVSLTENITTITFSNVPASDTTNVVLVLTQDATGGRTITWPASVKWSGSASPTLTAAANAIDVISLFTVDAGTTWLAVTGGLNFS